MVSHLAHQEPSPPPWQLQAFPQHWHTSSPQQVAFMRKETPPLLIILCLPFSE